MASHALNRAVFQPNMFLTEIHRLLVTKKGRSVFRSPNNCPCQLQTPHAMYTLRWMNGFQSLLRRDDEEAKRFFPPKNTPWQCILLSRYLRMSYSISW